MKEHDMKNLEAAVRQYTSRTAFRDALGIPRDTDLHLSKLAQGECNINFLIERPGDGKKLVLRVNLVSQMHLRDQIGYEYSALSALSGTGRTPKPLYLDSTAQTKEGERIGNGLMVYEYLPGRPLDYRTDLARAAKLLADVHSTPYFPPEGGMETGAGIRLIEARSPLRMILEECTEMFRTYQDASIADRTVRRRIERMLEAGYARISERNTESRCSSIINTELNSGNFLMNDGGRDYLIDWEKPLLGEPAQDLGHFLAPTTTFWKTDVLLTGRETEKFLEDYLRAAEGRIDTDGVTEALRDYLPITCLRGLTWSAMAWVQYQDPASGTPKNKDTWEKLCAYLSEAFLSEIEKRYFSD